MIMMMMLLLIMFRADVIKLLFCVSWKQRLTFILRSLANWLHGAEYLLRSCQSPSYSRISQHFMEPQDHCRVQKSLSQMNPVHNNESYFSKIHFSINSHLRVGFPTCLRVGRGANTSHRLKNILLRNVTHSIFNSWGKEAVLRNHQLISVFKFEPIFRFPRIFGTHIMLLETSPTLYFGQK
jgi:hypothetical protein